LSNICIHVYIKCTGNVCTPLFWKMLMPTVFAGDLQGVRPNGRMLYCVEFQMYLKKNKVLVFKKGRSGSIECNLSSCNLRKYCRMA